jgi:hypothetical protein
MALNFHNLFTARSLPFAALLILFSLLLSPTMAQRESGYVVRNQGDTIRGTFYVNDWDNLPNRIKFKPAGTNARVAYTKSDLQSVYVSSTNESFLVRNVSVNQAPVELRKLVYVEKASQQEYLNTVVSVPERAFLKKLIVSNLSLFRFTDNQSKTHFYTQDTTGTFSELVELKYIIDDDTLATQVVKTIKQYRNLLKKMTLTCPQQASVIAQLELNEPDLLIFFKNYNQCKQAPIQYIRPNQKATINLFGTVGFQTLNAKIFQDGQDGDNFLTDAQLPTYRGPILGLGALIDHPSLRLFSVYTDATVSAFHVPINYYHQAQYNAYSWTYQGNFDALLLKTNLFLRMKIARKATIKPFFEAGAVITIPLKTDYSLTKTYRAESVNQVIIYQNAYTNGSSGSQWRNLTWAFGAGFRYKQIMAAFRYEAGTGYVYGYRKNGECKLNGFSVAVSYQIKKWNL